MSPQNKDADVQAEESGEATKMTLDGDESSADEETDIVSPASDYSKYSYKAVLAQVRSINICFIKFPDK